MLTKICRCTDSMILPDNLHVPSHQELVQELESLQSRHPQRMSLNLDGQSRAGRDLVCVELGDSGKVIAVTGGAHSDEPAGTVTCLYLAKNLLENPEFEELLLRYRFVIHPMLDPDGAALNYRWAREEFSYPNYLLHSFRNNRPAEDCEHGIPVNRDQEIRPELAFFRSKVDVYKTKVEFYVTLHTTHRTGGSIFAISAQGDHADKISVLAELCERFGVPVMDVDLHGEKGIKYIAPGFIAAPPMAKLAERFRDNPEILSRIKMSTYEYVEHHCGARFCLISELPSILDQTLRATCETEIDLVDLRKTHLESKRKWIAMLRNAVEELESLGVAEDDPWFDRAKFSARFGMASIEGEERDLARYEGIKAKQYEVYDERVEELERELSLHKLYVKCLEGRDDQMPLYQDHFRRFHEKYRQVEALIDCRMIPLDRQVRIQTAMILTGADF
jgi:hypothetical protein